MRRSLVVLAVSLSVLGLTACGGGSSSTDPPSSSTAASSPEASWAKEVHRVMAYFENHVTAQIIPTLQDTYNQRLLEPLYRTYGADLGTLANKLEATKAPAPCKATQAQIADTAKQVAQLTTELGEQSHLSEKRYSLLLGRQGERIHDASLKLTKLTSEPRC